MNVFTWIFPEEKLLQTPSKLKFNEFYQLEEARQRVGRPLQHFNFKFGSFQSAPQLKTATVNDFDSIIASQILIASNPHKSLGGLEYKLEPKTGTLDRHRIIIDFN